MANFEPDSAANVCNKKENSHLYVTNVDFNATWLCY